MQIKWNVRYALHGKEKNCEGVWVVFVVFFFVPFCVYFSNNTGGKMFILHIFFYILLVDGVNFS